MELIYVICNHCTLVGFIILIEQKLLRQQGSFHVNSHL